MVLSRSSACLGTGLDRNRKGVSGLGVFGVKVRQLSQAISVIRIILSEVTGLVL